MAHALPPRPNLDWLRKTAKQRLRELVKLSPTARLADAQLALARHHGFSSWRALKAHIDRLAAGESHGPFDDATVASFLRAVGNGELAAVRTALDATPPLVNAVGPHPFWGGRVQSLHAAIDTRRRDLFDLLIERGASIDGDNRLYSGWSPLMLAAYRGDEYMQQRLLERGAHVGLFEALLLGDDARVGAALKRGRHALPADRRGVDSLVHLARTPFAIDRLLELGEARETRDGWNDTVVGSMARLGAAGIPLVRHLQQRGFRASAEELARMGDLEGLARLFVEDPSGMKRDDVLINACDSGNLALVQWMLERGATARARGSFGSKGTALHAAAWNGNLALAKLLVAAGADVRALDVEHENTPSGYARVSRRITNNPDCDAVAEYLEGLERGD